MGQTLSEPVTIKDTSGCQNASVKVGASCMQGWRISILYFLILQTKKHKHYTIMKMWLVFLLYLFSELSKDVFVIWQSKYMCKFVNNEQGKSMCTVTDLI